MTCAEIRFARDQGMGGSYLRFVHQATHAERRFSGGNGYCMPFGWSSWARMMAIVRYDEKGSKEAVGQIGERAVRTSRTHENSVCLPVRRTTWLWVRNPPVESTARPL